MKAAIVTYNYPNAETYVNEFLNSVEQQTQAADLICFNHGGNKSLFEQTTLPIQIIEIDSDLSIPEVRKESFRQLKSMEYDAFIFLDIDDKMSTNRVEICLELLQHTHIVCNDLNIITESGEIIEERVWSNRLQEEHRITSSFIAQKNILGFSNTAISKELLKEEVSFEDVTALDWFVFTQWLQNHGATFTSKCVSYYRVYQNNSAGLSKLIDKNRFEKVTAIRSQHYNALNNIGLNIEERAKHINFNQEINLPFYPFWWEEKELYEANSTNKQ